MLTISMVSIYLIGTICIGHLAARKMEMSLVDLFVANRSLGLLALVMSIFGSQITAFGMLSVPSNAYQMGYSTMGYMIGLAAFTSSAGFYLIGYRTWLLADRYGYVTPVDFLGDRWGDNLPRYIVAVLQILLEIPYILICGIGAGVILSTITAGAIPYWLGALLILVITTYVAYAGGMRGTAWTNIYQGFIMLAVIVIMMVMLYRTLGGSAAIVSQLDPSMISLGGKGPQSLGQWIPYSFLCTGLANGVVMHMLIRNMSASSPKVIQLNTLIYPVLYGGFFFITVSLGVWGSVAIPGLSAMEAENIIPMLAERFAPTWMIGLLGAGILSAIMSSWDGMLLASSSIFSDDLLKPILKSRGIQLSEEKENKISRFFILFLSVVAYLLVLLRPTTILAIATFSFAGFACLFPAYFGALYWKRCTKWGAITSSVTSVVFVALSAFNILPKWTSFNMHYSAPGFILAIITLVGVSLLTVPASEENIEKFFSVFEEVYEDAN
ncbi:sodium:solute symporter family protein [Clostridium formicaceticum]|nr:sodium:solute symporter family protein [Clostridium formicaceticum]ARE89156.1 Sodium/pantothenate symporter [Clostridium formicaceticum]